MTIQKLYIIIKERITKKPQGSYVAGLCLRGKNAIVQKVGEEAVEVVIAAQNESRNRIISECADLLFHTLVLLAYLNIKPNEILAELEKRSKTNRREKMVE